LFIFPAEDSEEQEKYMEMNSLSMQLEQARRNRYFINIFYKNHTLPFVNPIRIGDGSLRPVPLDNFLITQKIYKQSIDIYLAYY